MRVYVAIALLALTAILAASGANAYFELDKRLIGEPVVTKLADGRLHIKHPEIVRKPFPADVPLPGNAGDVPAAADKEHYYSFRAEAVMKAHWQVFDLEEHTSIAHLVCHDSGDMNMRLSVSGASDKLIDYLKSKKDSVVLSANANRVQCHGMPIFRQVQDVKFVGGDKDEIVLITRKARYDEIFDHADIALDIKHPQLTHIHSDVPRVQLDENALDHGVLHETAISTPGAAKYPATMNRMYEKLTAANSQLKDKYTDDAAAVSSSASARSGAAENWFSNVVQAGKSMCTRFPGLCKKFSVPVINNIKRVANVVEAARNRLVDAVTKGIQTISSAVSQSQQVFLGEAKASSSCWLLCVNVNVNKKQQFDKQYNYARTVAIVQMSFDFHMYAGFTFILYIKDNSFKTFQATVYGGLDFSAAAQIPTKTSRSNADTTLYTIWGFKISFSIYGFSVFIESTFPILGGYDLSYSYGAQAGFKVSAYAEYGVKWTSASGFQTVATRQFTPTYTFTYDGNLAVSAYCGPVLTFNLNGMATGSASVRLQFNGNVAATSACSLASVTATLGLTVTGALSINIKIIGISIYSKSWGPWNFYSNSWTLLNVCKQRSFVAGAIAARADAESSERAAVALADPPVTSLGASESGKVWKANIVCNANLSYELVATGFFEAGATLYYIAMSRNYTEDAGNYSLISQDVLAYFNQSVALGLSVNATLLVPSVENAAAFGLDQEDLDRLSQSASGNENISAALPIEWVVMNYGASDLQSLSFSNPNLCPPQGQSSIGTQSAAGNTTMPPPPPEGSMFGRMFAAFAQSLFPAFVRLITDVLVTVLILAILEIVVAWFVLPRIVGAEHWPKQAQTPRTREYIYLGIAIATGIVCYISFIVGMNVTFAQITGANLQANYTPPANPDPASFLVASGVQTTVFEFTGAQVKRRVCKQYFPCSPNCRDLCVDTVAPGWVDAALLWPYCPADAVKTDNGGCTKVAFDAIADAILSILFLVVFPVIAVFKSDNVYRRLPIMHACLMLSGMFLCLLWRRVHSFMKEVEVTMFDPTPNMVVNYDLALNPDSEKSWESANAVFFTMVGLIGVASIWDMYNFYIETLEGRIVKFDETFEGGSAAAMSGYKKPSTANDTTATKTVGDVPELSGSVAFRAEVAADLGSVAVESGSFAASGQKPML